ncbi:hypothetical protein K6D_21350 [Enterococcus faecium]|nr:hypothetical protein K6D_21290 [Enterococcus faecium]BDX42061.1 hypothetical protein K6D_21350 [Enterococcus faecium]
MLELAVAVARNLEMKFPVLGLDRTVIGAVTRITRVKTNAIVLFVIEESR